MTQPYPLIPPGWHRYDPTCGCAACAHGEPSSPYLKVPSLDYQPGWVPLPSSLDGPPLWGPSPRPPAANVAAIIGISCALIGLVVLPILLGPAAIVAGIVGEHQARTQGRKMGKVSMLAIVIGSVITLIAVDRVVPL